MPMRVPLIIPVENQVRELDPKLLLACIAARRGFSSVIGSHREIDFRIAAFPRSLYLCKSFTVMNLKMFRIMHRLGHEILSWDEEALVHLPAPMYYSRRLSPASLRYVSHLFAWGEDNAALWRDYPLMRASLPIHVTGNPRADLLRPDLRAFYRDDAGAIRREHGTFILVNTNFNHVNACHTAQNLFRPSRRPGGKAVFGKAGRGMSLEFATALREHKQTLFEEFCAMIPRLERDFPDCTIVVRPHPTESPAAYRELAARGRRVRVIGEGNVVAWLLAARALVHNGCTTGAEAYAMGVPAISYRPRVDAAIDEGFYRLPNALSHQCFSYPELRETLTRALDGALGVPGGEARRALIDRHLAAREGALACERMVDVLEAISGDRRELPAPPGLRRATGRCLAHGRHLGKWFKSRLPGSHAPPQFHRHRYPGISLTELRGRLSRLQQVLGDGTALEVEPVHGRIFRISAC